VRGIVHKSAPTDHLVTVIRAAAEGREVPVAAYSLRDDPPMADPLTIRELEVLALVAAGLRNAEIGVDLHVSVNTVEFHMRNLLGKLAARSRTEAVGRARALGYSLPEETATFD
jgi:LuxR family maltose regulon positive regulatory protein